MKTPKQSRVRGGQTDPLLDITIGACLDQTVERWPRREALVSRHQDIRWTYADLKREVDAFAAGLLALGLRPGDRVGIWAPNCAEWMVTQYATARAGLILVNINPAYRGAELEYALGSAGCAALITAASFKTSDYVAMLNQLIPELAASRPGQLASAALPGLKTVILLGEETSSGFYNFADISDLAGEEQATELAQIGARLRPGEAINIQFTSGTTGFPKGATLTHFNILNNARYVGQAMDFSERDRLCVPVPLYHCFGMVMGNLNCLTHGACVVYPGQAFEAGSVLEAIEAEKCTALFGVPTMFIAELDHPNFADYDLTTLRTGCMAGSPCPREVMKRVVTAMHMAEVTIAYGMTETSPVSFQTGKDDPLEQRVSTVGRIHPHLEVKIVDAAGQVVPLGETGELLTRGYSVMLGYWNDQDRTAQTIDPKGWMHTGDLATLDDQGYCRIVGRLKDMVIRGGENIYPREVEEFLYTHPKIQDVQVFGVPDEKFGEELCAWIQLKAGQSATAEEITGFCRDQIAHFKVPRHIRFVADFPMTVTGKIQKFAMRERMAEELGLKAPQTAGSDAPKT